MSRLPKEEGHVALRAIARWVPCARAVGAVPRVSRHRCILCCKTTVWHELARARQRCLHPPSGACRVGQCDAGTTTSHQMAVETDDA